LDYKEEDIVLKVLYFFLRHLPHTTHSHFIPCCTYEQTRSNLL